MTLRGADGHARSLGDLLERVAGDVLQEHDLSLRRRDAGERLAQLAPKLRVAGAARRVVVGGELIAERLVASRLAPIGRVEARVHDDAVEPSRELRAAVELLQAYTHLRKSLLSRIARVLGVAQELPREALHLRCVALEQRLERLRIADPGPGHEDRVAQLLVDEAAVLPKRLRDRVAPTHAASLDRVHELSPEAVLPLLRGRLGQPYRFVESCASTQRLLGSDDPEGAVVATDHQTAGRGRLGRTWEDVPGRSLLVSVLLRPWPPMPLWPELSLVAGKAVAQALRSETGIDATLRHPNDVVVAGRKLVGVLPEASPGRVVLGIGVNVNQARGELPVDTVKPSTSVRIEAGREVARAPLLAAILAELELGYDAWSQPYRR